MLLFLPALYDISADIEEAAIVDGASAWTRFRRITLPLLRPVLFLVLTLGLIGTWQVFDQVFLITQGNPAGTTLTPAYLAYQVSFGNEQWGQGAAIAFILFAIIVVFTRRAAAAAARPRRRAGTRAAAMARPSRARPAGPGARCCYLALAAVSRSSTSTRSCSSSGRRSRPRPTPPRHPTQPDPAQLGGHRASASSARRTSPAGSPTRSSSRCS